MTLAYAVMLLAMSYSIYLLGSVVAGVTIGHALLKKPRETEGDVEGCCQVPLVTPDGAAYVSLAEET